MSKMTTLLLATWHANNLRFPLHENIQALKEFNDQVERSLPIPDSKATVLETYSSTSERPFPVIDETSNCW